MRPRLSGICGSDLATVTGRSSLYFSPLVSLPFVPGHEVVGDLLDDVELRADLPRRHPGRARPGAELRRPRPAAVRRLLGGPADRCDQVTAGHLAPGLQTGYCADTGGGWSGELRGARLASCTRCPTTCPTSVAVLIEPLACAVHTARRAEVLPGERVLVVGAGASGCSRCSRCGR